MESYSFIGFGLIGLFLCLATVNSAATPDLNKDQENIELVNIYRHLILPDEDLRKETESMSVVVKKLEITYNFRVREGFNYEGKPTIPLEKLTAVVDRASLLEDMTVFQALNPYHYELATPLFELLYVIDRSHLDEVLQTIKMFLNKYLFHHVLRTVLVKRSDIDLNIPSHVTLVPYMYFEMGDLGLKKYGNRTESRIVLSRNFINDPRSNDREHRLEYFRLDPGMNSHHEHWHEANMDTSGYRTANWTVDRSGEMFYYMHSQMTARYNFERLCNYVPLLKPLDNLREPVPEPYFERLTTETRAKLWDSRPPNHILKDVNLKGFAVSIQKIEMTRDRIYEAVDRGFFYINKGQHELLEPINGPYNDTSKEPGVPFDVGIDRLGNTVWAYQSRSVNYRYYGTLHNLGHILIGNNHDPEGLYHEQSRGSAMTLNYAAPRDPAFYRWHTFIDQIFWRYKSTLPEYTTEELEFKGICIDDVEVKTGNLTNEFKTGWVKDTVNITEGVSYSLRKMLATKEVFYDFVHLDNENYEFNLTITNNHDTQVKGTVRIFLAPIYTDWKFAESLAKMDLRSKNESLKRNPNSEPSFNNYRKMFIELDKFVLPLKSGTHSYTRNADKSSVTIPFRELFKTLDQTLHEIRKGGAKENLAWTGCGWPQYLQIPRGNWDGYDARLFVMISDFEKDKAEGVEDFGNSEGSVSYCGIPGKPYPDRKPMGYPFDRDYGIDDTYLHHFISRNKDLRDTTTEDPDRMKNMKMIDVKIKHKPKEVVIGPSILAVAYKNNFTRIV